MTTYDPDTGAGPLERVHRTAVPARTGDFYVQVILRDREGGLSLSTAVTSWPPGGTPAEAAMALKLALTELVEVVLPNGGN